METLRPDLLTIPETAEWLRVSTRTIRNMIDRGDFPKAVKVGGHWRIPRTDVEAVLTPERETAEVPS